MKEAINYLEKCGIRPIDIELMLDGSTFAFIYINQYTGSEIAITTRNEISINDGKFRDINSYIRLWLIVAFN